MSRGTGANRFWPIHDGLGSERGFVSFLYSGLPAANRNYSPYGDPLGEDTQYYPVSYGFTGEWHEPSYDMVHLRARWYNATVGAFTSLDPFEASGKTLCSWQSGQPYRPERGMSNLYLCCFAVAAVAIGFIWARAAVNTCKILNNGVCAPDVPDVEDYPNAEDVQRWLDEQRKRFQPEPEYVDPDPKWFPFPFPFPNPNPNPQPRPQPTPSPTPDSRRIVLDLGPGPNIAEVAAILAYRQNHKIIAIEEDRGDFDQLSRNVGRGADRISLVIQRLHNLTISSNLIDLYMLELVHGSYADPNIIESIGINSSEGENLL